MVPSLIVPPVPQRFLSCVPSFLSSAGSNTNPTITLTLLPPRPLVSRITRTMPSPLATGVCCLQIHAVTGLLQPGHRRPPSVEYTSVLALLLIFDLCIVIVT